MTRRDLFKLVGAALIAGNSSVATVADVAVATPFPINIDKINYITFWMLSAMDPRHGDTYRRKALQALRSRG